MPMANARQHQPSTKHCFLPLPTGFDLTHYHQNVMRTAGQGWSLWLTAMRGIPLSVS